MNRRRVRVASTGSFRGAVQSTGRPGNASLSVVPPDAGDAIRPVLEREAVLFCLDNQQLRRIGTVERLVACRDAIHRAVEKGGPAAHAVRLDRIERAWP